MTGPRDAWIAAVVAAWPTIGRYVRPGVCGKLSRSSGSRQHCLSHIAQFQVGPLLSPKADRLFAQLDEQEPERSGEIFLVDLLPNAAEDWPPRCR